MKPVIGLDNNEVILSEQLIDSDCLVRLTLELNGFLDMSKPETSSSIRFRLYASQNQEGFIYRFSTLNEAVKTFNYLCKHWEKGRKIFECEKCKRLALKLVSSPKTICSDCYLK